MRFQVRSILVLVTIELLFLSVSCIFYVRIVLPLAN